MMIDIDDVLLFQIDETWSRDVRTLNDEHRVVRAIHAGRDAYLLPGRKMPVGMWHRIVHDDFRVFLQRLK